MLDNRSWLSKVVAFFFNVSPPENRELYPEFLVRFFAPKIQKEKNDSYIYYQFVTTCCLLYFIGGFFYWFALKYQIDVDTFFLEIPKVKEGFVEQYMNDYSHSLAKIMLLIVVPYFFFKMHLNTPKNHDFFSANPQWSTQELQRKRKLHIQVTSISCLVFFFMGYFYGYYALMFLGGEQSVKSDNINMFYLWVALSVALMPTLNFLILKSLILFFNSFKIQKVSIDD